MRRLLFNYLLITSILATPLSVLPCTCNVRPPACFEYWRDDAVFIGTVKRVNPISAFPMETVELSVDESFKGVTTSTLSTFNYGHSCAFTFKPGQSFLFYGSLDDTDSSQFATGLCNRTRLLENAEVDLRFLRAVKENRPVYWAWGTITYWGYDTPLAGIRAEVLGQRKKIAGISNDEGDILLEVPKAGTYTVRIHLPKGRTDVNGALRNEQAIWEMQRKQIVGGRFRGSRPYVDYRVEVQPNRCGWFDVSIPRERN